MTLRCCRCHDHKTDPLTHEDHYRLRAFFAGVKLKDDLPIDLAPEQEVIRRSQEQADAIITKAEKEKQAVLEKVKERLAVAAEKKPEEIDDKEARKALTEEEKADLKRQDETIRQAKEGRKGFTIALGVSEDREKALAVPVLSAGDPDQPQQPVEPGVFTRLPAGTGRPDRRRVPAGQPASGPGGLAGGGGQSLDRPRDREPLVAAVFRRRPGGHRG